MAPGRGSHVWIGMRITNARRVFLLVLLPCLLGAAPLLQVGKFSFPEFDAEGAKIRRLEAESANGPLEAPVLGKGALEFFGQGEQSGTIIARLEFTEAVYDRARSVIRGDGAVYFRSAQGEVWGTGYSYDLAGGELRLDSKVGIRMPQGLIRAGKGEVWLDPQADASGNIEIRRAELSDGVEATELKDTKSGLERAKAARASYTASDRLVRLPAPVDVWRGGQQGRIDSESVTFEIGAVVIATKKADAPAR
jgi:hypothetical protein